jgi:hypothetical protein
MHQTDQGLFKSMLFWAVRMLERLTFKAHGGKAMQVKMNEFNRRWKALLPFPEMKNFGGGISHLTQMNAYEYRDMMKGVVVVFRGNVYIIDYIPLYAFISVYICICTVVQACSKTKPPTAASRRPSQASWIGTCVLARKCKQWPPLPLCTQPVWTFYSA